MKTTEQLLEELGKRPSRWSTPLDTAMCYCQMDPEELAEEKEGKKLMKKIAPRIEGVVNGRIFNIALKEIRKEFYLDENGFPCVHEPSYGSLWIDDEGIHDNRIGGSPVKAMFAIKLENGKLQYIDYTIELGKRRWTELKNGDVFSIEGTEIKLVCKPIADKAIHRFTRPVKKSFLRSLFAPSDEDLEGDDDF